MTCFNDSEGRQWEIAINIGAIKRVAALCGGINLANALEGAPPLIHRLQLDLVLLIDVIFALVKPQADTRAVTDEQFGQAMTGDAITRASDAFWQEFEDFFHQLRRPDAVKVIQKQAALVKAAIDRAGLLVDQIDPDNPPGPSAGSSPGLSASTPPA